MKYLELSKVYKSLQDTSKRLKKTALIAKFLQGIGGKAELEQVVLILQGRVFSQADKQVLGLSEKLIVKAITTASGASEKKVMNTWRTIGDLGEVAAELLEKKTQATLFSEHLTVKGVFEMLRKLSTLEGHGSTDTKVKLVAQLLSNASGVEAIYIVRSVLGDLRVGVSDGTLRDSIFYAFLVKDWSYNEEENVMSPEANTLKEEMKTFQSAIDKSNDFALVARVAKEDGLLGLAKVSIEPGRALKVMLAQKELSLSDAFEKVGLPCAVEFKYDGFRMQVHKDTKGNIKLFTRRLEEVTAQFPDVVEAVKNQVSGKSFIIDAEAVGYDMKTGKYKAFQDISQRIRRKYEIARLAEKLPVELCVFDVLHFEGKDLLDLEFAKRRAFLEGMITTKKHALRLSQHLIINEEKSAQKFYEESLRAGNEGIMLKKLDAPYQPGSRVGTMIKLKPTMDTFDLAIVGAEWGTGKRSGWLTSYTVACFDQQTDELVTIGKFGTGIKEKEEAAEDAAEAGLGGAMTFEEITKRLKPHIISTSGREVKLEPDIIVEVKFEEIQKSPTYTSGYALRFPRFVQIRDDRGIEDMTILSTVETAYARQRGRN